MPVATISAFAKGEIMPIATGVTPSVQALIMEGGQGERIYPLSASRPKPAVPFGGVFRILDQPTVVCPHGGLGAGPLSHPVQRKPFSLEAQDSCLFSC